MSGTVYFDGTVSSMPTGLTSSGLTIIITAKDNVNAWAVSYTHLTLPTMDSV